MEPSKTSWPSAGNEAIEHLLRFGVAALATWRLTHLLANEDGPADAIARLRERLGTSELGQLMDCFHCASIWVAMPFAFYVARKPASRVTAWLALSAAACLLQEIPSKESEIGVADELLR
jgi:hypothetical protein